MNANHQVLGSLIAQVSRQWRQTLDKKLQPFGLTQATWLPLWYMARASEPLRQKDLAKLLAVDGSALVRILDTLEKQQFIYRQEGQDRRVKTLHLTDQGQAISEQVGRVGNEVRQQVLGPIDDKDLDTTLAVLQGLLVSLGALEQEPKS